MMEKRPLFVLDMPCYCDEKSNNNDQCDEAFDENDENDSLDENIEALFHGVSDDSDLDLEDVVSRRSRSSGKRSIRVQSAPTVINEKRPFSATPYSFKPTEVKPFKMTLRQVNLWLFSLTGLVFEVWKNTSFFLS